MATMHGVSIPPRQVPHGGKQTSQTGHCFEQAPCVQHYFLCALKVFIRPQSFKGTDPALMSLAFDIKLQIQR